MGGRRYGGAAKTAVKSQDGRAIQQLIRTLSALFDAVPGQRRVGQSRCYAEEASSVGAVTGGKRSGEERKKRERGGFWEREMGEERESYEKIILFAVINLLFLCNNINKRNKIK